MVADTRFSKKPFVFEITLMVALDWLIRFDADLLYLSSETKTGKRGLSRIFAYKMDPKNNDKEYFKSIDQAQKSTKHSAIVYSKSLKCIVRLVHVNCKNNKSNEINKPYFALTSNLERWIT